NANAGSLHDLNAVTDWSASRGGRIGATLPLLAAFLDKPFEPSPYSPASRLFWNEFFCDVGESRRSDSSGIVDYRKEMAFRRQILERDAAAFFRNGTAAERASFDEFVMQETDLESYAQFRAVAEYQRTGWNHWPARLRDGQFRSGDYDPNV